jgi:hypothetical protein
MVPLGTIKKSHKDSQQDDGASMTIDALILIAALLFGFVGGYGVRAMKSRQRQKRFREKYWYGSPRARVTL